MELPVKKFYVLLGVFFVVLMLIEFGLIPLALIMKTHYGGSGFRTSDRGFIDFLFGWLMVLSPVIFAAISIEIITRMREWAKYRRKK